MDQIQDVSNRIVQLITEAPGKTMLGVRLGAALRAYFPDFQPFHYHCRNLRQFIKTYVPSVSEKGRSGLDVVYVAEAAVKENASSPPQALSPLLDAKGFERLPTTANDWKAYSNPAYPFVIAANRRTGALRTVPQDSIPGEPWVIVPKPTSEVHLGIANEFASSLPEPSRTNLRALLHDPKWYVRFSAVAARNDLGPKWASFRRTKLIDKFNSSLRELAVPPIKDFAPKYGPQVVSSSKRAISSTVIPSEEFRFRELVCKIVSELPLSELRSLKLPVGAVFDALKS